MVNALDENGDSYGYVGAFFAVLMLVGGIVSIASRESVNNGGNIALFVLFGLAALMGFAGYENYSDLVIWSSWCLVNAVLAIVDLTNGKKKMIQ